MKPKKRKAQTENDSDIEIFTKMFKKSTKQLKAKLRHVEKSNSQCSDESGAHNEVSDNYTAADIERARRRMSPDSDSEDLSDCEKQEDYYRARNRMSPEPDSEEEISDEEKQSDYQRALRRMSPSGGSCDESEDEFLGGARQPGDDCLSSDGESFDDDSDDNLDYDNGKNRKQDQHSQWRKGSQQSLAMADIPFQDLQLLKEKIGLKAFNQAMRGERRRKQPSKSVKRQQKGRPMEMSSKKTVPRLREVVQVKKRTVRDPRFDDISGQYRDNFFKSAYGFISDIEKQEKEVLVKSLKEEKDEEKKRDLQSIVKNINQKEKLQQNKEKKATREREIKKQEASLVQKGKSAFYLKKADRKTLELADRFRELKKSGKVEKYLAKKRKKNAQKEKKKLLTRDVV